MDGWIGCTLPDAVFGKEVEIISEENPMIKAAYAADSVRGGTEEPGVLPWIHFHAPSGKILDVKAFFQEENGEWHISLLEDFSMGSTENEGRLREYRSKDLYLWEAKSRNGKGYGKICRAEGTPWAGDVQLFFYAENKNGEKIGFALSRFFSSGNLPVNHVLSIPVKYTQSTAKRKNGKIKPVEALKNLRIWKRDWYLQRIEKEC